MTSSKKRLSGKEGFSFFSATQSLLFLVKVVLKALKLQKFSKNSSLNGPGASYRQKIATSTRRYMFQIKSTFGYILVLETEKKSQSTGVFNYCLLEFNRE